MSGLYQTCALQIFLLRTVLLRTVLKFEEAQFIIFNFVNHAFGVVPKKCSSPFRDLAHGLYAFVAQSMLVKSRVRESQGAGGRQAEGLRPWMWTTRDSRKQCSRELLRDQCGWLLGDPEGCLGIFQKVAEAGEQPRAGKGQLGLRCHCLLPFGEKMTFFLPSFPPPFFRPSFYLFISFPLICELGSHLL